MNQEIKDIIEEIASYDQCAIVPPEKLAVIFSALFETTNIIELSEYARMGCSLPKVSGAFTYENLPVHYRAVNRGGIYYIIFCTCHNDASGNLGEKYILFKKNAEGVYMFYSSFSSATVMDWVKRAFNECAASRTDPGLLSTEMYNKLSSTYEWCVQQGMTPVNDIELS